MSVSSIFSDIFSLGCLIYELYTGEQAFVARDTDEYLRKIQERDIEWSEKLPPKIAYLVKKWLVYQHYDRPHILEIADFLEAL